MKKFIYVVAALFSFAMVACTSSTDSLIKQYEKACEEKDRVKMLKVAEKLEKTELTLEQQEHLVKITRDAGF